MAEHQAVEASLAAIDNVLLSTSRAQESDALPELRGHQMANLVRNPVLRVAEEKEAFTRMMDDFSTHVGAQSHEIGLKLQERYESLLRTAQESSRAALRSEAMQVALEEQLRQSQLAVSTLSQRLQESEADVDAYKTRYLTANAEKEEVLKVAEECRAVIGLLNDKENTRFDELRDLNVALGEAFSALKEDFGSIRNEGRTANSDVEKLQGRMEGSDRVMAALSDRIQQLEQEQRRVDVGAALEKLAGVLREEISRKEGGQNSLSVEVLERESSKYREMLEKQGEDFRSVLVEVKSLQKDCQASEEVRSQTKLLQQEVEFLRSSLKEKEATLQKVQQAFEALRQEGNEQLVAVTEKLSVASE